MSYRLGMGASGMSHAERCPDSDVHEAAVNSGETEPDSYQPEVAILYTMIWLEKRG